jgi:uncharacterized protein YecA (UPF0149 family)
MSRLSQRCESRYKPASMRAGLAWVLELTDGAWSPAGVEGFFAAISIARRPVAESVWYPKVFNDRRLSEDTKKALFEITTRAYDEVLETMVHQPASCVPPAWTEERCQWCDGFVKGMRLCGEPPRDNDDNDVVITILVHMDVLGGGFAFEDFNRCEGGKRSEDEWRKAVEQHLPQMVEELCYEMAKEGVRQAQRQQAAKRLGRNCCCPCGSGKKYKSCCGARS